jgi:uncharacterized protein (TIGR00369 family)
LSSRHELQRWVDESPFGPWWGLRVEAAGKNSATVRLPYRPELQRLGGVLQGTCVVVVADVAMWIAIIATVEGGERAVTVNLATDYLAPARDDIVGTATLIKVGRRLVVGSVDTRTPDGTLVAVHRVTYALLNNHGRP